MKVLARIFSVLTLLAILSAGFALIWLRTLPPPPVRPEIVGQIDHILVEKSARRLTLFRDGKALHSYKIALGFAPFGDKERQSDGRTPEGIYKINRRNDASAYYLSIGIDYPLPEDIARAKAGGFDPGGDIFFHGQPNALRGYATLQKDWTLGCIALADAEMDQLWAVTAIGTKVEIRP